MRNLPHEMFTLIPHMPEDVYTVLETLYLQNLLHILAEICISCFMPPDVCTTLLYANTSRCFNLASPVWNTALS
jgi:hypothetical protein